MLGRTMGMAAVVGGMFAGSASAQQPSGPLAPTANAPLRAVYVTTKGGDPKIYYVTGTVPSDKVPSPMPAAPASSSVIAPIPPALAPVRPKATMPVRTDVPSGAPATLPPAIETHAPIEAAPSVASCVTDNCKSGHCKHGPTSCWTCLWTPATVPPPLGASVRGAFDMQRDNALGEYFVVYREDWLDAKFILNDTGIRHVDGIIRRLGMIGAPVRLEATGIAELDARRKAALIEKLVQSGVSPQEAGTRVRFGTSRAEGLRYHDVDALYNRVGGTTGGSGFGGSGGYGGFGGGFGGTIGGFSGYR